MRPPVARTPRPPRTRRTRSPQSPARLTQAQSPRGLAPASRAVQQPRRHFALAGSGYARSSPLRPAARWASVLPRAVATGFPLPASAPNASCSPRRQGIVPRAPTGSVAPATLLVPARLGLRSAARRSLAASPSRPRQQTPLTASIAGRLSTRGDRLNLGTRPRWHSDTRSRYEPQSKYSFRVWAGTLLA